ncbi:elongation factor G [Selenomonas sp. TAMA-11512]|uniref:elongation factor G n=1 Tax=Selenomonas sp. TAMA-11512 TaxID=3095337 RepID=UPI0030D4DB7F
MPDVASKDIRNVAIVGHGKSGKTSIAEACMFNTGAVSRLGKSEEGTTVSDFSPEEAKRGLSVEMSLLSTTWKNCKLNILDTPGYPDFSAEVKSALMAADSALIVVSASSGIKSGTEKVWNYANEMDLPRAFFINKIDREHGDFKNVLDELRLRFGKGVVPVQLPVGNADAFQGVVDLLAMTVRLKERDKESCIAIDEIPEYMEDAVREARELLLEGAAEINNELLEKYIEGEHIEEREVAEAVIEGIVKGKLFPVLCGSAIKNVGMHALLNDLVEYMPSPATRKVIGRDIRSDDIVERGVEDAFSAQVFKTVIDPFIGRQSFLRIFSGEMKPESTYYNATKGIEERIGGFFTLRGKEQTAAKKGAAGDILVVSKLQDTQTGDTFAPKDAPIVYDMFSPMEPMYRRAVFAAKKGDEEKVFAALSKEAEEDLGIAIKKEQETQETVICTQGELQLEILKERVLRKFSAEIILKEPRVAYRETIKKKVKAEGKHKKQSGGHGQYGHVFLELSPNPAGSGNSFEETIFGGSVPRQFIPAVEKGVQEVFAEGIFAGYPVVDVHVNLVDGSYHNVDSSEAAFKAAAAIALKRAFAEADAVLLEPIGELIVRAPEYYMGDILGQLNAKRAKILGMEAVGKDMSEVRAEAPIAALSSYATELRSLTQGRGIYSLQFIRYEEVPEKIKDKIVAESQKEN